MTCFCPHLPHDLPPFGQRRSRGLSSSSPAPAHLVVVDGNVQVGGHAPLDPGGHGAAGTEAHVGHPEFGGRWRVGGVWEGTG